MTYHLDIVNLFVDKYLKNEKLSRISKSIEVSIPTLRKWIDKYSINIACQKPVTVIKNTRTCHSKQHIDTIKSYVNSHEGCSLNNIYHYINKIISKPTICRILKNNNVTRKRFKPHIVGKDPELIEKAICTNSQPKKF